MAAQQSALGVERSVSAGPRRLPSICSLRGPRHGHQVSGPVAPFLESPWSVSPCGTWTGPTAGAYELEVAIKPAPAIEAPCVDALPVVLRIHRRYRLAAQYARPLNSQRGAEDGI